MQFPTHFQCGKTLNKCIRVNLIYYGAILFSLSGSSKKTLFKNLVGKIIEVKVAEN